MAELHFAGISEDQTSLVLVNADDLQGERFTVRIDGNLVEAVRQAERAAPADLRDRPSLPKDSSAKDPRSRRAQAESKRASGSEIPRMSPREIQAALRGGKTVNELADEQGVDPARIERFAAPILAEQFAAVERAAHLFLTPNKKPESALPLVEAVRRNLLERGVRPVPGDDAWSAYLHAPGEWIIRIDYVHRGKSGRAEWRVNFGENKVSALNRSGSNLGWVDPDAPAFDPDAVTDGAWDDETETAGEAPKPKPKARARRSSSKPQVATSPEVTVVVAPDAPPTGSEPQGEGDQGVEEFTSRPADTQVRSEEAARAQGLLFPLR